MWFSFKRWMVKLIISDRRLWSVIIIILTDKLKSSIFYQRKNWMLNLNIQFCYSTIILSAEFSSWDCCFVTVWYFCSFSELPVCLKYFVTYNCPKLFFFRKIFYIFITNKSQKLFNLTILLYAINLRIIYNIFFY